MTDHNNERENRLIIGGVGEVSLQALPFVITVNAQAISPVLRTPPFPPVQDRRGRRA